MGEGTMQLLIAENSYTITEAILTAYVIDPAQSRPTASGFLQSGLFWNLRIEVSDECITFWHQDIQLPNLRRWTDLVGHVVSWNTPTNRITGEMNGGWYGGNLISGHLDILEASLRFTERQGCKLHLEWEGICNAAPLGCEPDPDERLPFKIGCWCVFEGVSVPGVQISNESEKCELIARFLDINDFTSEFVDIPKYVPGVVPLLKPHC